jgi:hypothetical protein
LDPDHDFVELAVPPLDIFKPEIVDPLKIETVPLLELKCVKWKSKFVPTCLVRRRVIPESNHEEGYHVLLCHAFLLLP